MTGGDPDAPTTIAPTALPRLRGVAAATAGIIACWAWGCLPGIAQQLPIRLVHGSGVVNIQAYGPNIVGIHFEPEGRSSPRTLVLDPSLRPRDVAAFRVDRRGNSQVLVSPQMSVVVKADPVLSIEVRDSRNQTVVTVQTDSRSPFLQGGRSRTSSSPVLVHDVNEELYGISGLPWHDDTDPGILRTSGGTVAAGFQGDGGAPFFFRKRYGVLVDSDGGGFVAIDDAIRFRGGPRPGPIPNTS